MGQWDFVVGLAVQSKNKSLANRLPGYTMDAKRHSKVVLVGPQHNLNGSEVQLLADVRDSSLTDG